MARDSKNDIRLRIHKRIRSRVAGTRERPRLAVFRSVNHIYAQVIDDRQGHTLVAAASTEKDLQRQRRQCRRRQADRQTGRRARQRRRESRKVVFDRGGYLYHGRVKALGRRRS